MNKIFRSIFLLKSFSTGLLMPVMSLMIIARGVPLARLAIVVGVYSLTVVVLEFPSGVFCDLVGRKKCFLLSCVLMLISLAVILAGGEGMAVMAAAFVIQGTGRAFASGSLDALVIERSKTLGGDEAVAKTSGELGVLESVGIALGSVAGGILGGLGHAYGANLMTMTVVYIIIAALVLTGVEEKGRTKTETADREVSGIRRQIKAFGQQMKGSLSFSWKSLSVRMLMILIFFTGIALFFVETYWQPGLRRLLVGEKTWLFGLVTFGGFGLTAMSSQIGAGFLRKTAQNSGKVWWNCLFAAKLLFAAAAIVLWTWIHPALFVGNYGVIYFLLGAGSVVENALLSKYTPDEKRASVMSLFSLVFQFGALTASAVATGVMRLK